MSTSELNQLFREGKGHDRDRRLLSPCWTWANPPWCSGPPGMSFSTITRWRNDTWPCQSGHCGTPATKPRTSSQQTPPSPPPVLLLPPLLWGFVGINVFTNLCYIIFSLSYIQQTPLSADCSGNCSILYTPMMSTSPKTDVLGVRGWKRTNRTSRRRVTSRVSLWVNKQDFRMSLHHCRCHCHSFDAVSANGSVDLK